ncbi:hypothetical protein SEUCBS139899_009436 [Sporothrix eucalyptigena]
MASPLKFGVELELFLGHKQGKSPYKSWTDLADTLSRRLTRAGVPNHVKKRGVKETYKDWSLMREMTIGEDTVNALYGIELVSPVFDARQSQWVVDIQSIYRVLDKHFTTYESPKCSTHVHVSTSPDALTKEEAANLAAAVLYYEPAIDTLMPAHRVATNSYWCRSNRVSHMFAGFESVQGIQTIDGYVQFCKAEHRAGRPIPVSPSPSGSLVGLDTALKIVRACHEGGEFGMDQAMNWFSASSAYGQTKGMTPDFVKGKVYKWNFDSLYRSKDAPSKDGTLEFRLPPGSLCAEDAGMWVSLAVTFVAGVLASVHRNDFPSPAGSGASVYELKVLLEHGRTVLGWQDLGLLQDQLDQLDQLQL